MRDRQQSRNPIFERCLRSNSLGQFARLLPRVPATHFCSRRAFLDWFAGCSSAHLLLSGRSCCFSVLWLEFGPCTAIAQSMLLLFAGSLAGVPVMHPNLLLSRHSCCLLVRSLEYWPGSATALFAAAARLFILAVGVRSGCWLVCWSRPGDLFHFINGALSAC